MREPSKFNPLSKRGGAASRVVIGGPRKLGDVVTPQPFQPPGWGVPLAPTLWEGALGLGFPELCHPISDIF